MPTRQPDKGKPPVSCESLDEERKHGTVKSFDDARGFGFISAPGSRPVFVHISDVLDKLLVDGDPVSYTELLEKGKVRATCVTGGTGSSKEACRRARAATRKGKGKGKGGVHTSALSSGVEQLNLAERELADSLIEDGQSISCDSVLEGVPVLDKFVNLPGSLIECGSDASVAVATYNLLHPIYATKYAEVEGVHAGSGCCNWQERAPAIAAILHDGNLDVYLLQEVGLKQIVDLRKLLGGQSNPRSIGTRSIPGYVLDMGAYDCVHFTHPTRAARDGVAILVNRRRLKLLDQEAIPFLGKGVEDAVDGEPYMCAAVALAQDSKGRRLLFASTHFYEKKAVKPEDALLSFLGPAQVQQRFGLVNVIIWGGDCNRGYGHAPPGFVFARDGMSATRPGSKKKCIDWIFASVGCTMARSPLTQSFVASTSRRAIATGHAASDHRAEAVVVSLL